MWPLISSSRISAACALGLLGRVGELHAAGLHAAAGQHLRLDDDGRRRSRSAMRLASVASWRSRAATGIPARLTIWRDSYSKNLIGAPCPEGGRRGTPIMPGSRAARAVGDPSRGAVQRTPRGSPSPRRTSATTRNSRSHDAPPHPPMSASAPPEGPVLRVDSRRRPRGRLGRRRRRRDRPGHLAERCARRCSRRSRSRTACVVDLRAVTFMDSTGIATLLAAAEAARRRGTELRGRPQPHRPQGPRARGRPVGAPDAPG